MTSMAAMPGSLRQGYDNSVATAKGTPTETVRLARPRGRGLDGVAQPGFRVGGQVADDLSQPGRVGPGDGRDDLVLAAEVPVHRAGRQPGLGDDVLHRRAVEPVVQEPAPGGVEDLLPAGGEVGFGDARHAPNVKRTLVLDKRG